MSRVNKVDGGVGPPVIKVIEGDTVVRSETLPEPADISANFAQVSIKRKNISGKMLVKPLGYRYEVKLIYPYLAKVEWGLLVALFNDFRSGYTLRFYPHDDEDNVYYDVVPAAGMATPYVRGKYVGYSAEIELTGKDVLPYIPRETRWSYFCSADESGYDADEVAHFCDTDVDNYSYDEVSHFSSGSMIASIVN
ncbi:MAG: hypothetical protein GY771_14070 [bacterium]|nr:hypothetical protein [bacterium]